jgi:superfamily II DNA or RNA helicase
LAAEFANKAVSLMERPTLILIDELEQFGYLLPHLRYETKFAHAGVTKENKDNVPAEFHKSDPKQLVKDFNEGKFPILVGTSCIVIGTDFKTVKFCINLRGGRSPIEVKQAVGRTTRLAPNKIDCIFLDFAIDNVEALARHAKARKEIYSEIYPSYSEIRVKT